MNNKEEKIDWDNIINSIDEQMLSPDKRGNKVRILIQEQISNNNISNWDMICFCLSFLSTQFLDYPVFLVPIKKLNKLIYQMHYQTPHEIGLLEK